MTDQEQIEQGESPYSNQTYYSTVDRLSDQAKATFESVTDGGSVLTIIVLLSGILSALFFWQNASMVFTNVWPPLGLALALAVGLLPNEGAFFGWRRIRTAKKDLTDKQLSVTSKGIIAAVAGSIFGTFALFVISFPYVPAEIIIYKDWLVFLALGLPIMVQVAFAAYFTVNERTTIENFEFGKLAAMGFDAFIKSERARVMSIVHGQQLALEKQLKDYGNRVGKEQADDLLNRGNQQLLGMGHDKDSAPVSAAVQTRPAPAVVTESGSPFSLEWEKSGGNGWGVLGEELSYENARSWAIDSWDGSQGRFAYRIRDNAGTVVWHRRAQPSAETRRPPQPALRRAPMGSKFPGRTELPPQTPTVDYEEVSYPSNGSDFPLS